MSDDPKAPHGYDENGEPKAPYGLNLDGSPRKSNRGARPGSQGNRRKGPVMAAPKKATSSAKKTTAAGRKQMLCELSSMLLETPLVAASGVPQVRKKIGGKQADALAGDAFIIAQFMPQFADGLIFYSQANPKALAWLDRIETSGPALVMAAAGLQVVKALAENHMNPNPEIAAAGRNMVAMRMVAMARAVNDQAEAYRASQPAPYPEEEPAPAPAPAADPYDPEPTRVNDFAGADL